MADEQIRLVIGGDSSRAVKALRDTQQAWNSLTAVQQRQAGTGALQANRMDALHRSQRSAAGSAAELAASWRQQERLAGAVAGQVGRVNERLRAMREATGYARELTGEFDRLGTKMLMVGAAGSAAIGGAVKQFANFDEGMAFVNARLQGTEAELAAVRQLAIDLGNDPRFAKYSALDVSRGMGTLAQGGMTPQQMLGGGAEATVAAAAAGNVDMAEAAQLVIDAQTIFNARGREGIRVVDQLAAAANKSPTSFGELSHALKMSGGAVETLGMDSAETIGTLAMLATHAQRGMRAGTGLQQFLLRTVPASQEAGEAMERYGIELVDAHGNVKSMAEIAGVLERSLGGLSEAERMAALQTIFGIDAYKVASAVLREGEAGIRRWTEAVDQQGAASEVARKQQDSLKGVWDALKSSVETTAITIGSEYQPAAELAASVATKLANALGNQESATARAARVALGLGTALMLIGGTYIKVRAAVVTYRVAKDLLTAAEARNTAATTANTGALGANAVAAGRAATGSRGLAAVLTGTSVPAWASWTAIVGVAAYEVGRVWQANEEIKKQAAEVEEAIARHERGYRRMAEAGYLAGDAVRYFHHETERWKGREPGAWTRWMAGIRDARHSSSPWERAGGTALGWLMGDPSGLSGELASRRIDEWQRELGEITRRTNQGIGSASPGQSFREQGAAHAAQEAQRAARELHEAMGLAAGAGGTSGGAAAARTTEAERITRADRLVRAGYDAIAEQRVFSRNLQQCTIAVSTLARETGILSGQYAATPDLMRALQGHPDRFREIRPGEAIPQGAFVFSPSATANSGWHAMLALDQGKLAGAPRPGAPFQVQQRGMNYLPAGWRAYAPLTPGERGPDPNILWGEKARERYGPTAAEQVDAARRAAVELREQEIAAAEQFGREEVRWAEHELRLAEQRLRYLEQSSAAEQDLLHARAAVAARHEDLFAAELNSAAQLADLAGRTWELEQARLDVVERRAQLQYDEHLRAQAALEASRRQREEEHRAILQRRVDERSAAVEMAEIMAERLVLQNASVQAVEQAQSAVIASKRALGAELMRQGDVLAAERLTNEVMRLQSAGQQADRHDRWLNALLGGDMGQVVDILQQGRRMSDGEGAAGGGVGDMILRERSDRNLEREVRSALAIRDRRNRLEMLLAIERS